MKRTTKAIVVTASLAGAIIAGTGIVLGADRGNDGAGNDTEAPITGTALERASAAALQRTGTGRVTETEVGDEESLYEVEVTLPDGNQVDVQLDERFDVVGLEQDGTPGDRD